MVICCIVLITQVSLFPRLLFSSIGVIPVQTSVLVTFARLRYVIQFQHGNPVCYGLVRPTIYYVYAIMAEAKLSTVRVRYKGSIKNN